MYNLKFLFSSKLSAKVCLEPIQKHLKIFRLTKRSLHCSPVYENVKDESGETRENVAVTPGTKPKIHYFRKRLTKDALSIKDFFVNSTAEEPEAEEVVVPYLQEFTKYGGRRKVFFDVYGCQMNVNDADIIWAILKKHNYVKTNKLLEADVVLILTCAIREGAESKIWGRLDYLRGINDAKSKRFSSKFKIGILGCMAERLKHQVLEKDRTVDLVAGPDSYRDLPRLLALTANNQKSVNVLLSFDETYADIMPVRLNEDSISAFVSIMRGCDNMCTYCIVPFTRGKERSRSVDSILREIEELSNQGVKEVTLLGQNVNSYRDLSASSDIYNVSARTNLAEGFKTVYKTKIGGLRFADLLDKVADVNPEMRIRFTSPHPKDFPDEVIHVIKSRHNICKNLHMPAQSGNTAVLERMRRGYTREAYMDLVDHVRDILPDVGLSSDFICGFCEETEEEFEDTITMMNLVKYNTAFLFAYSMREKTAAFRRYKDDVSDLIKKQRLERMIKTYRAHADLLNRSQIGKLQLILVEGHSKRSKRQLVGRNDQNIKVVIPNGDLSQKNGDNCRKLVPGDYVAVQINDANSQILKGIPLYYTTLTEFYSKSPLADLGDYSEEFTSFYGIV